MRPPCVKGAAGDSRRGIVFFNNPSVLPMASHLPLHRGGLKFDKAPLCKGGSRR